MEIKEQSCKSHSFSDLTVQELWQLTKAFCVSAFACLLIFGLPWALFTGLDFGAKSALSANQYSWLENVITWSIYGLLGYLLIMNLPYVMKYFGEFFISLGKASEGMSMIKQVLLIAFVIGYFFLWNRYPTIAFFFSILIFLPTGYVYERYKKLLKDKSRTAKV